MSENKEIEDSPSEEAFSQTENFDVSKKGPPETYDVKDFCPGIRIEAKDFDGKWYPAKVSDVDWTENEILVHFENWNTKFDEWIPMDSSRLRPIQKQTYQQKDLVKFIKGEEVMAMWSPYQKYPATIQAVLANDRYDVLFYDGFLKRLKSHKISKLEGPVIKTEVKNFTDIGTKEERRERKRKINVAELFHINKRSKKKGLVYSKSQDIKTYPVSKSKSRNSLFKKVVTQKEMKDKILVSDTNEIKKPEVHTHGTTLPTKALIDTIPAAFEVKYINGQSEMWSKQLYQRSEGRTAGKLDIVILNPQGRKFRSRNEIMKYCEENGIIYSHEAFDFSAKGRPKSKPNMQTSITKLESSTDDKDKFLKKGQRKSHFEIASAPPVRATTNQEELLLTDTNVTENKVFIGEFEVVIENGKFICPVKSCSKHFRRENLLHMHVKHYHPEFSKYLDYTPSVTDLAYARTVGGLDGSEVTSPAPRKIAGAEKTDKTNTKGENLRRIVDFGAENSKESKKPKLDFRSDSKNLSGKILNDTLIPTSAQNEDLFEGSQKSKSNSNNLSSTKNTSSFNERDTYNQDSKNYFLENKSVEQSGIENEEKISSHHVFKTLRHPHRLHNRKKTRRFQGSFDEHMKKKKLIQLGTKSQSKLGRHQQQSHLRHHLQQGKSPQNPISSQPCVEDSNSNTSSQVQNLARYPKSHSNLPNEISGKNNLLISSKTFSPVLNKDDETSILDNVGNIRGNSSLPKSDSNINKFFEGDKALGNDNRKVVEVKQINRRSYIAGLLKARKRKERFASFCVRKKRKSRIKSNIQTLNSGWSEKHKKSGLGQNINEPDDIPGAKNSFTVPIVINDSEKHDNTLHEFNFMKETSDSDKYEETYCGRKKKQEKSKSRTSLKLKIKNVDFNNSLEAQNNIQNQKSNYNKTTQALELYNKEFNSNESVSKSEILEVDDTFMVRLPKTENSEKTGQNFTEKTYDHINNFNNDEEICEDFNKNTENREIKKLLKSEKDSKYEISCNNLPNSYVLLENVCRKGIYEKYINRSSKRKDDENSKATVIQKFQKNSKKRKRKSIFGRAKDSRHTSRKKVRFENTVTEKWISFDESEEFKLEKSCRNKTDTKNREGRRGAERTKKLTKSQSDYEKEVNQVKQLDDSSRHENPIPHNNSGLEQGEGTEDSKSSLVVENDKIEKLRRNEIINCVCGIIEEDGLMIQCDICLCWQHGHCAGILRELDVPDKYICAICKNPYRGRESMKYLHDQEWLKEGSLPSLSFRSKREDIVNQRKTILKRSHDLSGSIALLARLIHSLRVKVNIAEKKDHPKLWLWAKKWTEKKPNRLKEETEVKEEKTEETINTVKKEEISTEDDKQMPKAPEPEAPIDSAECRLNLLDHLIHYQTLIDARLSCIESLVAELESMQDDAVNDEMPDRYPRTKATVQMLLRDLNTMKKIAII